MAIKTQMAKIANKEMDRREFLKYVGTAILSVIGVAGLMRFLAVDETTSDRSKAGSAHNNYGVSFYGK